MSSGVQSPAAPSRRLPPKRLWFGACAGAAAFAIQGFTSFMIAIQACKDGHVGDWGPLSATGVRGLLGAVTAFLLVIAIIGGIVSFRNWRAVSEASSITSAEGRDREAFMALVGLFVAAAFVIGIIWAGLPPALLNVCVSAR